jgi:polyphosphate kinase 2 (PPK2 family)
VDLLDRLRGRSVTELDDDEALLLDSAGREITTWRRDYPYAQRMSREEYERAKRSLQIELWRWRNQASESARSGISNAIHLVKLWFSVSRAEQRTRFTIRVIDPLRQWKLSPVDLDALARWDDYTRAKEAMFRRTDTPMLTCPLTVGHAGLAGW